MRTKQFEDETVHLDDDARTIRLPYSMTTEEVGEIFLAAVARLDEQFGAQSWNKAQTYCRSCGQATEILYAPDQSLTFTLRAPSARNCSHLANGRRYTKLVIHGLWMNTLPVPSRTKMYNVKRFQRKMELMSNVFDALADILMAAPADNQQAS